MKANPDWQSRPEAGTTFGIRLLMWVGKNLGRNTLRIMLYPITAYFYVTRVPERQASKKYLSRVFGRPARNREVFKHILSFARVIVDRFFFLLDRADDIPVRFVVDEQMMKTVDGSQAGIILAAHLGSFEAARILGPVLHDVNLCIVLDKMVNQKFVQLMEELRPDLYNKIIDASQDSISLGLNISNTLESGDWVGFLADRHRPGDRTVRHEFLGKPANFPTGPYIIASTFKAPIICVFCRITDSGYEVYCEVLSDKVSINRLNREAELNELVSRYVKRLEYHVRKSPYDWFNFFDFWMEADEQA